MDWFQTIKCYYIAKLWTKEMVRNGVIKKKITAAEYQEITGEIYSI